MKSQVSVNDLPVTKKKKKGAVQSKRALKVADTIPTNH